MRTHSVHFDRRSHPRIPPGINSESLSGKNSKIDAGRLKSHPRRASALPASIFTDLRKLKPPKLPQTCSLMLTASGDPAAAAATTIPHPRSAKNNLLRIGPNTAYFGQYCLDGQKNSLFWTGWTEKLSKQKRNGLFGQGARLRWLFLIN